MDWLNDRLYLVEDGRICRCNLDGDAMESVVVGFRSRPIDMKVDPYNGYLFWLIGVNSVGSESATTTTAIITLIAMFSVVAMVVYVARKFFTPNYIEI